jgi:hypothetical protein
MPDNGRVRRPNPLVFEKSRLGGSTNGSAAAGDPFAAVFSNEFHVVYRAPAGALLDAWYDRASNTWSPQQINLGSLTNGSAAAGDPFVAVFGAEFHVVYRNPTGALLDAWYEAASNTWRLQQINLGNLTNGSAAAGDPFVAVFGAEFHVTYRNPAGALLDAWYDRASNTWSLQQLTLGGFTNGSTAAGDPFVAVFNNEFHVVYRGPAGVLLDAWYERASNTWRLQQINLSGLTNGSAAAGDPFVAVFGGEFHVVYRDPAGVLLDAWFLPTT